MNTGGSSAASDGPLEVPFRGAELLERSLLNKDSAFTEAERDAFGLGGLLPPAVHTIEEQAALELEHIRRKADDLERFIGLAALRDRNETLFFRVLTENLEELLPIVYTPVVGRACQEFSHIMRRPRGLWMTPDDIDRIPALLRNASADEVRLIVVTDNERILGLGDLGCGGMGIPIGKLEIYSAAAGIHPAQTLPISLDVGTDNAALLRDPLYMGYRAMRLRGPAYDALLDAFVNGVREVFPRAVVQWEDFKQHNAIRVLDRYADRIASFNDDIQGTAAVVLAGIVSAVRATGRQLDEHRYLLVGAGAAGIGIARLIHRALREQGSSLNGSKPAITMLDSKGLLFEGRDDLDDDKRPWALPRTALAALGLPAGERYDLEAVVGAVHPTVLIGTTGTPGTFTEKAIREMAAHVETPVVMPLSNPTSKAEATPADVIAWTDGRALVATGSPFEPVSHAGRTHVIGQANNALCFPGIGLGAIVSDTLVITEDAFFAAAQALTSEVSDERLATGALYPSIKELRAVSRAIAIAVCRAEVASGRAEPPAGGVEAAVDAATWFPAYRPYVPGRAVPRTEP